MQAKGKTIYKQKTAQLTNDFVDGNPKIFNSKQDNIEKPLKCIKYCPSSNPNRNLSSGDSDRDIVVIEGQSYYKSTAR